MWLKKYIFLFVAAIILGGTSIVFYLITQTCDGKPIINDAKALRIAKGAFASDHRPWNEGLGFATVEDFLAHLDATPNCCTITRESSFGAPYWQVSFFERGGDKIYYFTAQIEKCGGVRHVGWTYGSAN